MTIPDMRYVIANRYNVILVCLLLVKSITIFPLCCTPLADIRQH